MKKTLLIALLLIPLLGISQTTKPIDGFLGIKFGSSRAIVMAAIKAKGGIYSKESSGSNSLSFNNVKLGPRKTAAFFVYFTSDKAYSVLFVFTSEDEPQTIEYYHSLVNDINENYGNGIPYKNFKSPFADGDGNEILALEKGYAKMYTNWKSGVNSIQVAIDNKVEDQLNVLVNYEDGTLAAEADTKQKAKEKSDY